jgi:hypothetical protein
MEALIPPNLPLRRGGVSWFLVYCRAMRQGFSPTKINENHNEKIRMYGKWFCKKDQMTI